MGKTFRELLNEELTNPEFKMEWDNLDAEFQIIRAMIGARNEKDITQKELSEMTGIAQGDISKIENGNANPSINTLKRLAKAFGKNLKISFEEPTENKENLEFSIAEEPTEYQLKGRGQEVENQSILASSAHPRTVGNRPEVEN